MNPAPSPCTAVILAAGRGRRMGGDAPKVMREVGNRPMIAHVALAAARAGCDSIIVVAPAEHQDSLLSAVRACLQPMKQPPTVSAVVQPSPLGTGDAARLAWQQTARLALCESNLAQERSLLVLNGDNALISADSLRRLRGALSLGVPLSLLVFAAQDPTGYGRAIINNAGQCIDIIEERDLQDHQRTQNNCYGGAMALRKAAADMLHDISCNNAQGEYYLTSLVGLLAKTGAGVSVVQCDQAEALGANDPLQLSQVEQAFQQRKRQEMLAAGVHMLAPETVWFSADTLVDAGARIEPHVVFKPAVVVRAGATIHAFSWLEGCDIGTGASVGPFARIRGGTELAAQSKIGNFVETKAATIGAGSKINHLSYVGDAAIGAECNIGAGTITCNYDGNKKHRTVTGNKVFVGSNSSLVAPVEIGDGAYIGSGSVITKSVEARSLAVARARQRDIPRWSERKQRGTE